MPNRLWHPNQTESGLIPPPTEKLWPIPEPKIPDLPKTPPLHERKETARKEAEKCLADLDYDNAELVEILMVRNSLSKSDAEAAVEYARKVIEQKRLKLSLENRPKPRKAKTTNWSEPEIDFRWEETI